MTQVPSHVLQDAFGNVGVELVPGDLRREEGDCEQRSLGWPGYREDSQHSPRRVGREPGHMGGNRGEVKGQFQSPRKSLGGQPEVGGQARYPCPGPGSGVTWKACV